MPILPVLIILYGVATLLSLWRRAHWPGELLTHLRAQLIAAGIIAAGLSVAFGERWEWASISLGLALVNYGALPGQLWIRPDVGLAGQPGMTVVWANVWQTDRIARYFAPRLQAKLRIIPNPVPQFPNRAAPDRRGADGRFRIVGVSRLEPHKGFDRLIQAFADVAEANPDWERVQLADGRVGFIAARYLRSPVDLRAFFEFKDGRWWLTTYVAGE